MITIGNVCILATILWIVIVGGLYVGAMLHPDYY